MPEIDELRSSALWDALHANPEWVAVAILLIAFIECFAIAGLIVPGVVLLYAAAFVAGSGELGIWAALGCAFLGAVAGDSASYVLGRRFGPAIRVLPPLSTHPEWIDQGEAFFQRHGVASVALGRFVGPIRPILPLIAGMLNFSPIRFYLVNIGSAVFWAPAYVLPGFLLGASLQHAIEPPPGLVIGLVILVLWCWGMGRLTGAAWRAGTPGGALYRACNGPSRAGALLRAPVFGAAGDTRLSVLAGSLTFVCCLGLGAAFVLAIPALAPWREFAIQLLQVLWLVL